MNFEGFPAGAFDFYERLEADNSKSFWDAHKDQYQRLVREPMLALADELEADFGPATVFRAHRDIRFSADKSPYKTEISATCSGGYVSLSARGLFSATGWWHVEKPQLERFRAAVAEEPSGRQLAEIVSGLERDGFEIGGEELKAVPKPYPRDHPRERLLRRKQLMVMRSYGLQPWLGTPVAGEKVVNVWRAARPLMAWLKEHTDS